MPRLTYVLFATLVLAACSKGGTGPDGIDRIIIEPEQVSLQRGTSLQLTAVVLDAAGDPIVGRGVSWRVGDASIATIQANGRITAVNAGVTTVTAEAGSKRTTRDVFVTGFSSVAFLSDDFTIYADAAEVLKNSGNTALYRVISNSDLLAIDQTVRFDGHQTLKLNQPAGGSRAPWLFAHFPEPKASLWIRLRVRFSPGWRPATAGNEGDTFFHWGWAGSTDQRGSVQMVRDGGYRLQWYAQGATDVTRVNAGPAGTEWDDGEWYDYVVHYERQSDTQVRQRFWLGRAGTTPTLRATLTGTMATAPAPLANRVQLGQEFYSPIPTAQAIWLGTWEVADGAVHADPFDVID
jgi:hypothetical protein